MPTVITYWQVEGSCSTQHLLSNGINTAAVKQCASATAHYTGKQSINNIGNYMQGREDIICSSSLATSFVEIPY